MPFYEYRCNDCQAEFETFVKTVNASRPTCPKCSSSKVDRKLSVFGVGSSQPTTPPAGGCGSCSESGSCPMSR